MEFSEVSYKAAQSGWSLRLVLDHSYTPVYILFISIMDHRNDGSLLSDHIMSHSSLSFLIYEEAVGIMSI